MEDDEEAHLQLQSHAISSGLLHAIRLLLEDERKSINYTTHPLVTEIQFNLLDSFNLSFNRLSMGNTGYMHTSTAAYDAWKKPAFVSICEFYGRKAEDVELFGSNFTLLIALDSLRGMIRKLISEKPESQSENHLDGILSSTLSDVINAAMTQIAASKRELRYDARLRNLLRKILQNCLPLLELPSSKDSSQPQSLKSMSLILHNVEAAVAAQLLSQVAAEETVDDGSSAGRASAALAEADTKAKGDFDAQVKKWMAIGLATVGGGVVVGVTGGLAAPLIGAGMGSLLAGLGITGTATMVGLLGSSAGAAVIGTLFGLTGGGVAAYTFKKRLGGLEECYFKTIAPQESSMHAIICISGWLDTLDDATEPWQAIPAFAPFSEVDAMVFDPQHLITLGTAIRDFLGSTAASYAATEVLKHTILGGLVWALVWPVGLLQLSYLIDNPWSIGLDRSRKAGELLAKEIILPQVQGKRPVTLVGWGLGARTIFYALLEIASAGDGGNYNAYGLIDSVYLFGAPVEGNPELWTRAASVVSGRFVNGYSGKDWFLYFLYRAGSPNDTVAGLHPMMTLADIQAAGGSQKLPDYKSQDTWAKSRIENFELSSIVSSHAKYKEALQDILDFVGFERLPQTEEQRSAPTLGSRTGSLQSLTDVNPEEKRKQILQFMPRKSSLAHAAPSPSTSQTPTPTLSSSMDKPRQRMSSRTFDRQDFRDKILLESTSNVSAKPPPIHVHVPPPTPVSVDTLFDSDIESGEKLDGDLGTDIGNVDIIDIYGSGFSSDTGKIMDVRGQNLMTPHMHGRRSSPIEAVFEPNALAIDPLSRGTSSVSLGEDEMDRREGNSWVGTDIDDRVYRGPVAEVVGTPYSAKPR